MTIAPALLDTDTLSEVMQGRDAHVRGNARQYLATFGHFTFSIEKLRRDLQRGCELVRTSCTMQISIDIANHRHLLFTSSDT